MTDDMHDETQRVPDSDAPAPAAPPKAAENAPKPKKKSRVGDIIVVIVLLATALGTAYFWAEISAAVEMKVWSKSGPRAAMAGIQEALTAGDVDAARTYLREENWRITEENGKITQVTDAMGSMAPPMPIGEIAPSGSMDDAEVSFRLKPSSPGALVTVDAPDGGRVSYSFKYDDSGWYANAINKATQ